MSTALPDAQAAAAATSLISADRLQAVYRNVIENHWVEQTGLFLSFPDSQDRKLSQQASVYEQAATGLLLLAMGDTDRARGIFNFFKKTWDLEAQRPARAGMRGLSNFYNADFGTDGIETTVHTGPNAWAGLFAARLANQTNDAEARQWALDVVYWLTNVVPHQDGAIAMGARNDPNGVAWTRVFSTENNISYYAMLTELLRSTEIDKDQRAAITGERDHVENWLVNRAINRSTYTVNRGYNADGVDRLAALDTVTWMISAVGPKKLQDRGIDPDRLMQVAAASFECQVQGHAGVDATDQKEADFIFMNDRQDGQPARPATDHHRLIWYEGLGEYILALATMADYHTRLGQTEDSAAYLNKAHALSQEFDQASLRNYPSGSAFAYATAGRFFRDGWETQAQSAEGPASSLIAAVWRAFAGLGIDPMTGHAIASVSTVPFHLPKNISMAHRTPPVLFGTSEEMVVHAWHALDAGRWPEAIEQAQATIQEWSAWALKLQAQKQSREGRLMEYDGTIQTQKAICGYWALNDVGGAYFILGKALDAEGRYGEAAQAFQQVATHYSLAQIWDPKGWFWSPMEAISSDFVSRDPEHYGNVIPEVLAQGGSLGKTPY